MRRTDTDAMNTETLTESLAPTPAQRAFATLMVLMALAALDQTIVATALPVIARDLHDAARLPWVFSAYLIAATIAVPLYGTFADRQGAKPVLLVAVALFLTGSLCCGLSSDMDQLIVARALQGAGGGGFLTLAMTAVARLFPPQSRARLQGLLGATYGLSTMAGPVAGGMMVEYFSWRWAFFINVPISLLAMWVLAVNHPRQAPGHKGPIDYAGALLLSGALVCVMLGTRRSAPADWPTAALAATAVLLAASFLWVQARAPSPLIPLNLFADRAFAAAAALSAGSGVMLFAVVVFMPLYFQTARGLSPGDSGWHLMPLMAGITIASTGGGRMMSATGQVRSVAVAACATAAASLVALGFAVYEPGISVGAVALCLVPVGIGLGALFPIVTVVAQVSAPMQLIGVATASPVLFRSVAGAIGVSALGALLAAAMAGELGIRITDPPGLLGFGAALGLVFWVAAGVSLLAGLAALALPARLARKGGPG